jgi:hypothetical protein
LQESGTINRTIDSQEQPIITAQVANIIRNYRSFETDVTDYVESFSDFHSRIYVPMAEYRFNSQT